MRQISPVWQWETPKAGRPCHPRKGSAGGWFRSLLALDVAGMPRTMRVEYPGAIYHIMDRGDRRESGSRLAGKVL